MLLAFVLLAFGGGTPGTFAAGLETIATGRAASLRPRIVLEVRLDSHHLPEPRRLAELTQEVEALWRPYLDVAIAWPGEPVARGLDDRLQLVITDRTPASGSPDALGWIDFHGEGRPSRIIQVSVTAARRMAAHAPFAVRALLASGEMRERFVARAIARSIAHELGHYLLESAAHAPAGLMRSHFSASDIVNTGHTHLRLDVKQVATLAGRLSQYARRPDAPVSSGSPQ